LLPLVSSTPTTSGLTDPPITVDWAASSLICVATWTSAQARWSFRWSFHLGLLGPTGAHWLDDPSNVSCKESTQQYPVDDSLLSCKQLPAVL